METEELDWKMCDVSNETLHVSYHTIASYRGILRTGSRIGDQALLFTPLSTVMILGSEHANCSNRCILRYSDHSMVMMKTMMDSAPHFMIIIDLSLSIRNI